MNVFATSFEELIYVRTYSKWIDSLKRRERWDETVKRYNDFMIERVPEKDKQVFKNVTNSILNFEIMPSMRSLWTAGKALERENICGYNCSAIIIDDPAAFSEILYILMCGCFDKNTLIKTSTGNKKISEITIDDKVLTYDEKNKIFKYINPILVTKMPNTKNKEKIEIELEDGLIIKCTYDHEFLTTNRGWVKACDLKENDDIKNFHEIN
jgi:hypothetical protein